MPLREKSIRRKLTGVILITSCTVVAVTTAIFIASEIFSFRENARLSLSTVGQIVAANSTAALTFSNVTDAGEILGALRVDREVTAAALYDKKGKGFAAY